ncbi:DUF6232 family protein [Pseudoroseomonas cervicalis]|uniref:DUF6232 family protein n=1 Tax=Teichococcus cervicalis TaxID=204525 RepID=UPI0022F155D7|nr:DUF6232 family protein [Pseudoroseomonas cervicalis]WBV43333.1 DUF6232 family protein [Pseudoroseomonas cervicalis]
MSSSTYRGNLLDDGEVQVSTTLIKVGKVTYPINGIGSVLIDREPLAPFVGLGLLCLGLSLISAWFLAGVAWAVIGAFLRKSILVLRTASGDQKALVERNDARLVKIKEAIERAVVERG